MAVAAAGREGSLEPAAGAGVGQGIQMWGPPCPAGPLLRGGILTVAVPGGSGDSLNQNRGHCLHTGPGGGGTAPAYPFVLGRLGGDPGRKLGTEALATMEVGLKFLAGSGEAKLSLMGG